MEVLIQRKELALQLASLCYYFISTFSCLLSLVGFCLSFFFFFSFLFCGGVVWGFPILSSPILSQEVMVLLSFPLFLFLLFYQLLFATSLFPLLLFAVLSGFYLFFLFIFLFFFIFIFSFFLVVGCGGVFPILSTSNIVTGRYNNLCSQRLDMELCRPCCGFSYLSSVHRIL